LERLDSYSLVIFISPNAVRYGLRLLAGRGLPARLQVAAVGDATARALESHNITPSILPSERFDSEALLELPELQQMTGREVLIVRGNGGRPTLGDTLKQRGATIEYAEVYRRECPQIEVAPLLERWPDEVDIVTATSNQILENLLKLVGKSGGELLRSTPLVVISERMRLHASKLGWSEIILADQAGDEAIVAAVCSWRTGSNHP
jgi:uroporphyrinogen-III synthase